MISLIKFFKKYWLIIVISVAIIFATGFVEFSSGRSLFGPDGRFGFWSGDVWSSENSQRFADAYSFSHIIHGIILYAFLWLIARHIPARYRFLIAIVMESGWELLENSPLIINRYRESTMSFGYAGDSVLNSTSDIFMMAIGYLIARIAPIWKVVLIAIVFEVGCLFWVRDNLATNIIMLIHPVELIRTWQSEGHSSTQTSEILDSTF